MRNNNTTQTDWQYAWYVVVLLTLAYALTIIDRVSLGLLVEPVTQSLGISDTQFGLLQGLTASAQSSLIFFALSASIVNWGIPCVVRAINQITPKQFSGQLTAIYTIVVAVIAIGLGPLVAGAVSDYVLGGDEHIGTALSLLSICGITAFILIFTARKAFIKEVSNQIT